MKSDLPASLVGGRVRPCRLFADPFSSHVASFGEVSETDSEAIPMAPLKQRGSLVLDDGPCSEIQEGGLKVIRRKYGIHSSLYGLDTGVHKVLYSYFFSPLTIMHGNPSIILHSGVLLVSLASSAFSFFDCCGEKDVSDPSTFPWSAFPDERGRNIARLPASVLYDEYQQAGTRRRRPFYAPPPRLTRATPPAARIRPFPSRTAIGDAPLMGIRQRLLTKLASARWELMKEWLEG
uniref:Uncharacterized protein n=1 Tax=Brassica oleracea TaxID=3712 RepID=A0A3P6CE32_BRAOL|nr:unnamed protein product [Brassica oleracea]